MNQNNKTISMLQRVPVILAVTAASYGLPLHAQSAPARAAAKQIVARSSSPALPAAPRRLPRQS